MQARTTWTEKMTFVGECEGHTIEMDAKPPFGQHRSSTPKELLAMAVAGCTGMDVVALMKKYKQPLEKFEIAIDAPIIENAQPPIFKELILTFILKGNLDRDKALEAVRLSQTKYCAVSAMIYKAVPIHYKVLLNDEQIGIGEAHFESSH